MTFEKSKYLKNILGILGSILLLVIISSILLRFFTHHGSQIRVPDFTNMSIPEANRNAHKSGVKLIVSDSVYVPRMKKGAVFSQNPKPGANVKKGRRVRVVINSIKPKKVMMPNLVGCSTRQAAAELISKGLNIGRLIYVSDIATNNVIKQLYRKAPIKPGKYIESGSNVDLVVGLNPEDCYTVIPNLTGMKFMRAMEVVHNYSLNVSRLVFDGSVKNYADSLDAIVYRQGPLPSEEPIVMGSDVSLYLSIDPLKIPASVK